MKATKENVLAIILKSGYNVNDANKSINSNFETAVNNFPNKTAKQIAKQITLYMY